MTENNERKVAMNEAIPMVGDIVLYEMLHDWQPGLGIRIYPAIVLYPNVGYGPGGLDLQVFCQPYEGKHGYHVSARRGEGPGTWQPKRAGVEQQPIR
jgi:hypothetical protein